MRFLAFFLALWAVPCVAQTTFLIQVASKTNEHPAFGVGHPDGYVVNGQQGPSLTLVRGQTYVFAMQNVSVIHPFYLTTSSTGGGGGAWTNGVTGNFATGNAEVTFTVPETAPDELWYQCGSHVLMGGRISIVSSTSTEDEASENALELVVPNPVRDVIQVRLTTASPQEVRLDVFASDGRRVGVLHEGRLSAEAEHTFQFDASGISAGVYVIRATTESGAVERRVVVLR